MQLENMSIDPKLIELTADVFEKKIYNNSMLAFKSHPNVTFLLHRVLTVTMKNLYIYTIRRLQK